MPRGDGTGPTGQGPMTGRAAGYCTGSSSPGFANPAPKMGMGFRRGVGRVFGRGSGFGRGGGHGFGRGPGNFGRGRSVQRNPTPSASVVPQNRSFSGFGRNRVSQNPGIRSRRTNKIW